MEVTAMPKKLERQLMRQASRKGLSGERKAAYVYGTLRKTGWRPAKQKKR
jgi:hypothetical protein